MREQRLMRLIVGGVLSIAALLAVIWFFDNFELVESEVTSGYSEEARRNPLLAAERFLARLKFDVASVSSTDLWRTPPDPGDVLVVYRFTPPAGERRRTLLREWIEAGGHLIIGSDGVPDKKEDDRKKLSGLLAELGVRVYEPEYDEDRPWQTRVDVDFAAVEEPVGITMSTARQLEDTEELAVAAMPLEDGWGLLQYEVGEGMVTVLADNSFLSNRRIGDDDHAFALALLVGLSHTGKVWLVHDVAMPSLLELAWQYAAQVLVALLVVTALWLWKLSARLGPVLPPMQAPRRDISEHLAASATYLWQLDRAQALFQQNRQRIEQAWLGKHYVLRAMAAAERCEWIAARTGLTPHAVERALYAEYAGEGDFIEMSSILQVLRTAL